MNIPRIRLDSLLLAGLLPALVGVAIPLFAELTASSPAALAVVPIMVIFLAVLYYDRVLLLLLILLFRSVGDGIFEATRFSIAGYSLGIGGAINACVILIVALLAMETPKLLREIPLAPWILFLLSALVGAFVTPDFGDGLRIFLSLSSYFSIFIIGFYFVRLRYTFDHAVYLVIASSVLPTLYAVFLILVGAVGSSEESRLASTFSHANIFAFYLMLNAGLLLYVLKRTQLGSWDLRRFALVGYLLLIVALLLVTKTRSAWIACFLLFVLYGIFADRRYLLLLVIAVGCALLLPDIRERIADASSVNPGGYYAKLNSFAWRLRTWQSGIAWMSPDHYAFGYGMNAFRYYSLQFLPFISKAEYDAHSVFVQLFFDLGILGLSSYLWVNIAAIRRLASLARVEPLVALTAGSLLAAYLLISMSDNILGYLVFNWYFWFLIGASCAIQGRGTTHASRATEPHAKEVA